MSSTELRHGGVLLASSMHGDRGRHEEPWGHLDDMRGGTQAARSTVPVISSPNKQLPALNTPFLGHNTAAKEASFYFNHMHGVPVADVLDVTPPLLLEEGDLPVQRQKTAPPASGPTALPDGPTAPEPEDQLRAHSCILHTQPQTPRQQWQQHSAPSSGGSGQSTIAVQAAGSPNPSSPMDSLTAPITFTPFPMPSSKNDTQQAQPAAASAPAEGAMVELQQQLPHISTSPSYWSSSKRKASGLFGHPSQTMLAAGSSIPPSPATSLQHAESWNMFAQRLRSGSFMRLASGHPHPTLSQVESWGRMSWEEHTSVLDEREREQAGDVGLMTDLQDSLMLYDMYSSPASPLTTMVHASSQQQLCNALTQPGAQLHGFNSDQGHAMVRPGTSPGVYFLDSLSPGSMGVSADGGSGGLGESGYISMSPARGTTIRRPATSASGVGPLSGSLTHSSSGKAQQGTAGPQPERRVPAPSPRHMMSPTPPLRRTYAGTSSTPSAGRAAVGSLSVGAKATRAGGAPASPATFLGSRTGSGGLHMGVKQDVTEGPHSASCVLMGEMEWPDALGVGLKASGSEGALDLLLTHDDAARELYHKARARRSLESPPSVSGAVGQRTADVVSLLEAAESAHRVALGAAMEAGPQVRGPLLVQPAHIMQQATFEQAAAHRDGLMHSSSGGRAAGSQGQLQSIEEMPGGTEHALYAHMARGLQGISTSKLGAEGRPGGVLQPMDAGAGGFSPRLSFHKGQQGMFAHVSSSKFGRRSRGLSSRLRHIASSPALDVLFESQLEGPTSEPVVPPVAAAPSTPPFLLASDPAGLGLGAGAYLGPVAGALALLDMAGTMPSVLDEPEAERADSSSHAEEAQASLGRRSSAGHRRHGSASGHSGGTGGIASSSRSGMQMAGDVAHHPMPALASLMVGRGSTPGRIESMQGERMWQDEDLLSSSEDASPLTRMLAGLDSFRQQHMGAEDASEVKAPTGAR